MYTYKGKNYEEEYLVIHKMLEDLQAFDLQVGIFDVVLSKIKRELPTIKGMESQHQSPEEQRKIEMSYILLTKILTLTAFEISECAVSKFKDFNAFRAFYEDERNTDYFIIKFEEDQNLTEINNQIRVCLKEISRFWEVFQELGISEQLREAVSLLINSIGKYTIEMKNESEYSMEKLCGRLVELTGDDENGQGE